MRTFILGLLFVLYCGGVVLAGKLPPLTLKDVSLMLRSGYSSEAVLREVSARHFVDAVDSAAEKSLLQAGATQEFVSSLKSGAYAIPADEIVNARKEMETREQHRIAPAPPAQNRSPNPIAAFVQKAVTGGGSGQLASSIHGNLVTSKNGILQTFNNQTLEKKKLIALYFAARWCPNCRKFTPQLVEFYNRVAAAHADFEIVFVSADRSASAMEDYMRDTQMPWPAVAFDNLSENEGLRKYAGAGIPCLVLVDASGRVISDSYDGKTYLGPGKVLADLDRILGGGAAARVAR